MARHYLAPLTDTALNAHGTFTVDGPWMYRLFFIDDGPKFPGFTKGESWNGWSSPAFPLDVAIDVLDWCERQGRDFGGGTKGWYNPHTDTLWLVDYSTLADEHEELVAGRTLDEIPTDELESEAFVGAGVESWKGVAGPNGLTLYQVGSWSWIRSEEIPDDASEDDLLDAVEENAQNAALWMGKRVAQRRDVTPDTTRWNAIFDTDSGLQDILPEGLVERARRLFVDTASKEYGRLTQRKGD